MPYPYDNGVFATMAALAQCLCEKNTEYDLPGLCFCGIIAGDAPYDATGVGDCDDDGCGQGWVRLSTAYPSTSVGIADITPGNCGKALGMDIEVGVLRCFPMGDNGEPSSEEEMLATSQLQIADMLMMREVIMCCVDIESDDVVLGEYLPIGPEGQPLVGGTWRIAIQVL